LFVDRNVPVFGKPEMHNPKINAKAVGVKSHYDSISVFAKATLRLCVKVCGAAGWLLSHFTPPSNAPPHNCPTTAKKKRALNFGYRSVTFATQIRQGKTHFGGKRYL